jgi:hypothetical protein
MTDRCALSVGENRGRKEREGGLATARGRDGGGGVLRGANGGLGLVSAYRESGRYEMSTRKRRIHKLE